MKRTRDDQDRDRRFNVQVKFDFDRMFLKFDLPILDPNHKSNQAMACEEATLATHTCDHRCRQRFVALSLSFLFFYLKEIISLG